jgi:hypothetical protein
MPLRAEFALQDVNSRWSDPREDARVHDGFECIERQIHASDDPDLFASSRTVAHRTLRASPIRVQHKRRGRTYVRRGPRADAAGRESIFADLRGRLPPPQACRVRRRSPVVPINPFIWRSISLARPVKGISRPTRHARIKKAEMARVHSQWKTSSIWPTLPGLAPVFSSWHGSKFHHRCVVGSSAIRFYLP